MQAMTYSSPEWCDAPMADKQAVVAWVNTLDLPSGDIMNLLHTDGAVVVEYGWIDQTGTFCCDVHTCTASVPPPEFYACSRRISPADVEPDADPLVGMAGAWRALSWQMVLEVGRRLRLWP